MKRRGPGNVGNATPLPAMDKCKPYKCSICGAEVRNLPMPVLQHQMSHVARRPLAHGRPEPQPDPDATREQEPIETYNR